MSRLTDLERELLAFEREWWRSSTTRDRAVHDRFGMSAADYHRTLSQLIDRDEALEHDPLLVRRLRRLRASRRAERASRRTS